MNEMNQYSPKVAVYRTDYKTERSVFVDEVKLSDAGLEVTVTSKSWKVDVVFDAIYGFRVLDEGDLTEFWSECNLKMGWCFTVSEGGWLSLESSRAHFVSGKLYQPIEFLIIGQNECVSIMAQEEPKISEVRL